MCRTFGTTGKTKVITKDNRKQHIQKAGHCALPFCVKKRADINYPPLQLFNKITHIFSPADP